MKQQNFIIESENQSQIFMGFTEGYLYHAHLRLELMFVFEGNVNVIVENSQYALKQGDILIVNPFERHAYFATDKNTRAFFIMFPNTFTTQISDMLSNKIVTEEGITYLKMSPAKDPPAPSMAVKQQYFYANPDVVILNETRNRDDILGDSIDNYRLNLDSSTVKEWSLEEYKVFFNTNPTTPLTYIVSDITCSEGLYDTNVTLGSDGTYTFKIKMNGAYASAAALYYSYEIRHFSEEVIPTTPPTSSQLPSWKSVEMTVQVDSNFNFLNIDYVENYSVYKFGVNAGVTDRFSDVFYYDEETIQEYLELI